jgi:membrane fusion protein (multidrug efflux system)
MKATIPMTKPLRAWTFRAAGALAVYGLMTVGCRKAPAPASTFAVPVTAAEVLVRDTTNYVEYIGQTSGARDVEIRARVAGFLETVAFSEGTVVRSNALLYTIDSGPFQAGLAQAEGRLAEVEAGWLKTRQDTNRFGPLWERHAISRQQYDDAIAAERAAAAGMQAARAAVDAAQLQLGYTRIHSPIDGLVGKTEVKPGNLVGQGATTLLTTVSSLDPIHVRFSVSEKRYLEWRRKHGQSPGTGIFELILADGSVHPEKGGIIFADRQVDPATGTLLLEVFFPNPKRVVRPGQYARIRFPVEVIPNAILVPQRSVQELQATYSVFVVGAEEKAQFRKITVGPASETFYVVREGLKPGDKVVLGGVQKLRNGVPMQVTLTNLNAEFSTAQTAGGR